MTDPAIAGPGGHETVTSATSGTGVRPEAPNPAAEYVEVWANVLAQVLTQVAGRSIALQLQDVSSPPTTTDLQMVATAAGALRGEMSVRIAAQGVIALAQVFLGESPDPAAEFKPEHREAVEELFRQVAGQTATALTPRWGEVQLRIESVESVSWSPAASGWLTSSPESSLPLQLGWQLSPALHAMLLAAVRANEQPQEAASTGPSAKPPGQLPGDAKLDVVLDAELEVMLRFGSRTMILRDILELGPGSVVELDRQVQDPADLLLDGKLIARGEVVVVEGHYGLRVLEVISTHGTGE